MPAAVKMRACFGGLLLAGSAICGAASAEQSIGPDRYLFEFRASFRADSDSARAEIVVRHRNSRVRELSFRMPRPKYTRLSADGDLRQEDDRWIWLPPADGGALSYDVRIASTRGSFPDARITQDWVIMRLEDLFPTARARAVKSAVGSGELELSGPKDWSFETPYGDVTGKTKPIEPSERIYPQPKGWLIGGEIGVRRELIAGRRVVVAAPKTSGLRRMDILAFLHWTLPEVTEILPEFPTRLLIVGAPQPMWLGALSAPGSLYLHADRPLVSENGTSTLVHELIHVGGVHSAGAGADWIVEGLAEYYAVEVLQRSGGIGQTRREKVLRELQRWVARQGGRLSDPSNGADTAAAVLLFVALNEELCAAGASLDRIVRRLVTAEISVAALLAATREALGRDSQVLARQGPVP